MKFVLFLAESQNYHESTKEYSFSFYFVSCFEAFRLEKRRDYSFGSGLPGYGLF